MPRFDSAIRGDPRGDLDDFIDAQTAVVELPFHPNCGLHIDHHLTNKPTESQLAEVDERGGKIIWEAALSAARVCFDTFKQIVDLSDIEPWMEMVDKLDGGKITRENFSRSSNRLDWQSHGCIGYRIVFCSIG